MSDIRLRWTPNEASETEIRPMTGLHALYQSELFTDELLIELLDQFPRSRVEVFSADDGLGADGIRRGRAGRWSGAELLQAAREGRFWIKLRGVQDCIFEYSELAKSLIKEIGESTGGAKLRRPELSITIASPNVRTAYELDIPMTTMWQVRGHCSAEVYPTGAPYAPEEQLESIVLGERETVDYDPKFDTRAQIIDLGPGGVATWPQTAPYRVTNGDELGVTLACRFYTKDAARHAKALYTNAVLRRRFGLNPQIAKHGPGLKGAKAALATAMKAFSSRKSNLSKTPPTFTIDPGSAHATKALAAA